MALIGCPTTRAICRWAAGLAGQWRLWLGVATSLRLAAHSSALRVLALMATTLLLPGVPLRDLKQRVEKGQQAAGVCEARHGACIPPQQGCMQLRSARKHTCST